MYEETFLRMPPPFSTTAVDLLLKSCTRKMRLPMMPHTSDLFFMQWADKFYKAEWITFIVGSPRPGSTADPMGVSTKDLADTDMAAIISTDTTRDSERTDLEDLSAFQARFLNRCAVAFLKFSSLSPAGQP